MTFGVLTLIVLAGLVGPVLGSWRAFPLPLAVGEIFAGVVIGRTGLGWIDPNDPTVAFLGDVGFAMLMLAAGMHVPIRAPGLRTTFSRAVWAALAAAVLAIPAGLLAAWVSGTGHARIYALLLAGGSAAIALPALVERRLLGHQRALTLVMQIALADVAAIVAVPLVLQPSRALRAGLASIVVSVCAFAIFLLARSLDEGRAVRTLRRHSAHRGWALDLRVALLVLVALCWLALRGGTSILVAGFASGLVVSALGGPARLSAQVTGVAEGFFVPLFFVVLGARIDLSALWSTPRLLALVAVLVVANVVTHLIAARVSHQQLCTGFIATAQLGLPAAIASLGLSTGVLLPGEAAAIVAAGLCSLPIAARGVMAFRSRLEATARAGLPGLPSLR